MILSKYNIDMDELLANFDLELINSVDNVNITNIILFLETFNISCIDELITQYLDLFTLDYIDFKTRFSKLKAKYPDIANALASNLDIFGELYE